MLVPSEEIASGETKSVDPEKKRGRRKRKAKTALRQTEREQSRRSCPNPNENEGQVGWRRSSKVGDSTGRDINERVRREEYFCAPGADLNSLVTNLYLCVFLFITEAR